MVVRRREWLADPAAVTTRIERTLSYPLFVKPANLGSSVGISKVHDPRSSCPALTLAADFDRKIVVELAVPEAREIECAVLGNDDAQASVARRDHAVARILRLRSQVHRHPLASRDSGAARRRDDRARCSGRRSLAFEAIDGSGLARVDFLLSRTTGDLFLNEINTMPGFTTISMYSKLWAASGVDYPTLVDRLVALAIARQHDKQQLQARARSEPRRFTFTRTLCLTEFFSHP